ncbi:MAG: hypothetical protein HYY60_01840 [Parcubacteria group bacterium]|nr:hypothetical protein [Parcubacteria group bacterium]MBI3074619.1 hypothetical protein [Parcubacteria group bacterium]
MEPTVSTLQTMMAEFPAGVLLVSIVIGVPVLMYVRELNRRRAEKEKGAAEKVYGEPFD